METKSLYLHVPFCKTICGYCDFCHFIFNEEKVNKWLTALEQELLDKYINPNLYTIYIGGGTPTSLNYQQLKTLFNLLKPYTKNIKEYTIEANPESIDEEKVILFNEYNINRVSLGVQSSDNKTLKLMNRFHSFDTVKKCVKLLKDNNINNISVDLMYGIPNQSIETLENTIEDIISLDVPHISIYCLTIESNTLFDKKGYKKVDEDLDADMYELINKRMIENNYKQYEISNYCKEGYESIHNLTYWNYEDFYGISMSASGKEGQVRYDNTKDFNKYLSGVYVENITVLNKEEAMFEHLMMGFRLKEGFSILNFNKKYDVSFLEKYKDVLEELLEKKLLIIEDDYLKCSDRGYIICNDIIQLFM